MNDLLDEAFGIAGKKHRIKGIVYGTATNITDTFCTVEIEGEPPINKVKLHGIDDSFSSFFRIKPKDGSMVVVGIIEGDTSDACVLQCSEIDEVLVKIGNIELLLTANGIAFNGGQDKGLVKLDPLVTQLNTIEQSLNDLKQVFTTWVAIPNDGGAALKTAVGSWAGQPITETTEADLENTTITQ